MSRIFETLPDRPGSLRGLDELERRMGYAFARPALLRVALTLGSWVNEHRSSGWPSNACLEYYGDAVIGLAAADALWRRFPNASEGELTRLRATLVSEAGLADAARALGLGDFLFLGRGDVQRGARDHAGTLADAMEAVIASVFLDARERGGDPFGAALGLFERLFADLSELDPDGLDAKSRLQQRVQAAYRVTPTYVPIGEPPPGEAPHWHARVEVRLPDRSTRILGHGEGRSLRAAEQAAAEDALGRLGE